MTRWYVIRAIDRPDTAQQRAAVRSAHREFLSAHECVRLAGALLNAGGAATGSLVIIEAESAEAAQSWWSLSPYARAGLFKTVDIHPFSWTLGGPGA